MEDDDRSLILSRRAAYIGSALAVLSSCARSGESTAEAPTASVIAIPTVEESDAGEITKDAPPGRADHWIRAGMPSLDVPQGVSDKARINYERLAQTMTEAHALLDDLESTLPANCLVTDARCESSWRAFAEKLDELTNKFRYFHTCRGSSTEAKEYAEREQAHLKFYQGRYEALDKQRQEAVKSAGPKGNGAWSKIQWDVPAGKAVGLPQLWLHGLVK